MAVRIPFRGDSVMMGAAACLLVIAYLGLGSPCSSCWSAISRLASASPAILFPRRPLVSPASASRCRDGRLLRAFGGSLLPLRWYHPDFVRSGGARTAGLGLRGAVVAVGGLAVGLFGLAGCGCARSQRGSRARAARVAEIARRAGRRRGDGRGVRRILTDSGVFGLIVLAPLIYGLLYPQPYLGQVLRGIRSRSSIRTARSSAAI